MTKILKAMPFGSARGERQNRIKSVKCLDSALLIDTEHCGVDRRLKVQANDVGHLLFKLRVIAVRSSRSSRIVECRFSSSTADVMDGNFCSRGNRFRDQIRFSGGINDCESPGNRPVWLRKSSPRS